MSQYHPQVQKEGLVLRASSVALTNGTYDASPTTLRVGNWNQLVLFCDLNKDAATTTVEIKVQVASPDGDSAPVSTDWFDLSYADSATVASAIATIPVASAVYQMSATGKLAIPVPLCYKYARVQAKTTGPVNTTTLQVRATWGMS